MIELSHVSKSYGKTLAVADLSLHVERGEIFGLLGPNGAGKSSTVKCLTGLSKPTTGSIRMNGIDLLEQPMAVKEMLGYVPENALLYDSLTANEYIDLVAELRHMDRERAHQQRDELFTLFGLTTEDRTKLLNEFSKGMRQKVLIASALIHNPDILILDEPLSGLDVNAALIFKELLRRFASRGKTIFFCSHVLDVVEKLCDRIGILNNGELIAIGTPQELMHRANRSSLELAFNTLTNGADIERATEDIIRALSTL